MKQGFIKVGAGTPDLKVADCVYNADRIIQLIQEMGQAGAKIIVLPELCITAYTCGDLFWQERLLEEAKEQLVSKSGAGNDFVGWIDLPEEYDKEEFARIKKAAQKIQSDSDVLIVIGIGGSYLGARAAIEFLRHGFYNNVSKEIRKTPEIYYAGNSISSTYLAGLIEVIGDRDFSVNIISKSGTTTEPAIAFRVFKEMLEKKYGKKATGEAEVWPWELDEFCDPENPDVLNVYDC